MRIYTAQQAAEGAKQSNTGRSYNSARFHTALVLRCKIPVPCCAMLCCAMSCAAARQAAEEAKQSNTKLQETKKQAAREQQRKDEELMRETIRCDGRPPGGGDVMKWGVSNLEVLGGGFKPELRGVSKLEVQGRSIRFLQHCAVTVYGLSADSKRCYASDISTLPGCTL